jgi:hypothetical protein
MECRSCGERLETPLLVPQPMTFSQRLIVFGAFGLPVCLTGAFLAVSLLHALF